MKQDFLEKRIDGAKLIDQVCKRAVSEIGNSNTSTGKINPSKNLIEDLISTLIEANVLELFFGNK